MKDYANYFGYEKAKRNLMNSEFWATATPWERDDALRALADLYNV